MNKHVEKAKELRNATPMVHNCAQTIMEVYADDLGINKELANHLGCNFGWWYEMWERLWCYYQWFNDFRSKRN